jgi:hypothetical protein
MHIHMYIRISLIQSNTSSKPGFWNVVYCVHRLVLGSACRNLADRLAVMDFIPVMCTESGRYVYMHTFSATRGNTFLAHSEQHPAFILL